MRAWLLAGLLLAAAPAGAVTIFGRDYRGANLAPSDGDVLSGTFTNVGHFYLLGGTTVFVSPGDTLDVYATTVTILGTLDGSGRGAPGGNGGATGSNPGSDGFVAVPSGQGAGGASAQGGGGATGYGSGGKGSGAGLAAGGTGYLLLTAPVSADDAVEGSGGGGGGGSSNGSGGNGGGGGAAIYIEASSITIAGAINAGGGSAAAVSDGAAGTHPGGGGGGGGGAIVLRATVGLLVRDGARLQADGGHGGNVDTVLGGTLDPGGGGGGGRILSFAASASYGAITVSTAAGAAGSKDTGFSGSPDAAGPNPGDVGFSTFGVVAQAPSGFAVQSLTNTSITYSWSAPGSFGDAPTPGQYRVFPATDTAPYGGPDAATAGVAATISGLTPNTTYYRFVTAYTDWGDSAPSNAVSTHTLADVPGAAAAPFSSMGATSLTASWTSGANGNPSYTIYEVDRSSDPAFGVSVSTGYVVSVSSSPDDLLPNTSYYFRVRAINADNVPTAYATTLTTATLAATPASPSLGTVFVTSVSFSWARAANPADTKYEAQVSSDNFFSVTATSQTLMSSATFFSLQPGTQYYLRVFALNREGLATSFSTVVSTALGNLSNTTPPTDPGTPQSDVRFSYDGKATFSWSPASSPVGILGYNLIIGSTPGGSDIANVDPTALTATQYTASSLPTGQTVYARVRAESNAGVFSGFSTVSAGVPVFITVQESPFAKAINWPNPFNPSQGPTQIGLFMASGGDVRLRIFTLRGRLVHEQSYSFSGGGDQIVTWDGRNDSGARVAPGGYIVLLQLPGQTQKLKIAVLY